MQLKNWRKILLQSRADRSKPGTERSTRVPHTNDSIGKSSFAGGSPRHLQTKKILEVSCIKIINGCIHKGFLSLTVCWTVTLYMPDFLKPCTTSYSLSAQRPQAPLCCLMAEMTTVIPHTATCQGSTDCCSNRCIRDQYERMSTKSNPQMRDQEM